MCLVLPRRPSTEDIHKQRNGKDIPGGAAPVRLLRTKPAIDRHPIQAEIMLDRYRVMVAVLTAERLRITTVGPWHGRPQRTGAATDLHQHLMDDPRLHPRDTPTGEGIRLEGSEEAVAREPPVAVPIRDIVRSRLSLMTFVRGRGEVARIHGLRQGSRRQWWRGLKLSRVLGSKSGAHELHPDGQGGPRSGFFGT